MGREAIRFGCGFSARSALAALGLVACGAVGCGPVERGEGPTGPATDLTPRVAASKLEAQSVGARARQDQIVLKLVEGSRVRLRGGALTLDSSAISAGDEARLRRVGLNAARAEMALSGVNSELSDPSFVVRRMFQRTEADLDAEQASIESTSGQEVADLNLYYEIEVPAPEAQRLLDALNANDLVEVAYPAPIYSSPATDIPPTTSSYTSQQNYQQAAPVGTDARFAWTIPGGDGSGMRIIDIEQSWNLTHEDMPAPFTRLGTFTTDQIFIDHGTEVLGEMGAPQNGYGVTGSSYGALIGVSSSYGTSVANAISAALPSLRSFDVILIEQQMIGPSSGLDRNTSCLPSQFELVPVEYAQADFDAIQHMTLQNINVVEAAGNGTMNLDSSIYQNRFQYSTRDSGAILVGAGDPSNHAPSCSTNYGSRVDVQAWGDGVMTLGYGDMGYRVNGADQNQWYAITFGGTSAASSIVASAVASLQGMRRGAGFTPYPASAIRYLLETFSTPQPTPVTKHIGGMPNLRPIADPTEPPATGNVVAVRQSTNVTSVFAAGGSQGITGWSVTGTGAWQKTQVVSPASLPPGAPLATGFPTATELDVFYVGLDGAVYRTYEQNDGTFVSPPVALTATNFAPPGAGIATGVQNGNQLDVFVVDANRNLKVISTTGGATWTTATARTGFAGPGAALATGLQGTTQLDVFAINESGVLVLTWAVGTGAWQSPLNLTAANTSMAGMPVATGTQPGGQLDVFFPAKDDTIKAVWVVGLGFWFGPISITGTDVNPNAHFSTLQQGTNQLDVFYVNYNGDLRTVNVVGTGAWSTPTTIATGIASQGAATAAATQGSSQFDLFTIANFGVARSASTGSTFSQPVKMIP